MADKDWQKEFPLYEKFEDFSGKERIFFIDCWHPSLGYVVRAREKDPEGEGYEFSVFNKINPFLGLVELRKKIRRSMATRYLTNDHHMLNNKLRGRIEYDERGPLLVVDGLAVSMSEFVGLLSLHNGFEFEFSIIDEDD
jgi:hypothetical protein